MKDWVLPVHQAYPAWLCINFIFVCVIWHVQKWRQQWSLPSTLVCVFVRFTTAFIVAIIGYYETYFSHEKDIITFIICKVLFVSFLYGATISSRIFLADFWFADGIYFSERTPKDKVTRTQYVSSVLITITEFVGMHWFYWRYLKLPITFTLELPYFRTLFVMLSLESVADISYGAFHHLILHGPLWFTHKLHHGIYRPTIVLGRYFDALDWFIEYHVPECVAFLGLHYFFGIDAITLYLLTAESWGISLEHHCGKCKPSSISEINLFHYEGCLSTPLRFSAMFNH